MATWYVRPDTSHSGTRNGTSYATAWGGWSEIVWGAGGVVGGDTLEFHGEHTYGSTIVVGNHGAASEAARVSIVGQPGNALYLTGTAFFSQARSFTRVAGLNVRIAGTGTSGIYCTGQQYVWIEDNDVTRIGNATNSCVGISIDSSAARSNYFIRRNRVYGIRSTAATEGRGINMLALTASLTHSNFNIEDNEIFDLTGMGIRLTVESAAAETTVMNNITIRGNRIYDCKATGIWLRSGPPDTTTLPSLYSSIALIDGNDVRRCGTVAGDSGFGGGISCSGYENPVIRGNDVHDCYVTGAGIQTAKNKNIQIYKNRISGIRSGTPTGSFQSGLPIDGNGIFADNLTAGGVAFGNVVWNLVSTGVTNSGTAYSFWEANNFKFFSNLAFDCYRGASYGSALEYGNAIYNNTFIRCAIGVTKIGTNVTAGPIDVRNNVFIDCPVAFSIGANPGITEDYSRIYGTTTAYIGISQGTNSSTAATVGGVATPEGRPLPGSPLINAGTHTGYKLDIDGVQFNNPPTIGAYEYVERPVRE